MRRIREGKEGENVKVKGGLVSRKLSYQLTFQYLCSINIEWVWTLFKSECFEWLSSSKDKWQVRNFLTKSRAPILDFINITNIYLSGIFIYLARYIFYLMANLDKYLSCLIYIKIVICVFCSTSDLILVAGMTQVKIDFNPNGDQIGLQWRLTWFPVESDLVSCWD